MSNIDESVHRHEKAFLKASTAQMPMEEIRHRMHSYLKMTGESRREMHKNVSAFDRNKHVLHYLPSPTIAESPEIVYDLSGRDNYEAPPDLALSTTSSQVTDILTSEDSSLEESLNLDPKFESVFRPKDMKMLALVSHNNMKHSMKQFVLANKNVLKKFRVTGTNTTMTMLREVFGDDPDVVYGPSCKSGPLGGDAQLVAMAVTGELGGCIFFIDPMDSHPHSADIDCLVRQGNVHNILMMNNPCSAHVCMNTVRVALKTGHLEMIPSFFFDLESPSVEAYKLRQKAVLESNMRRKSAASIKMLRKSTAPRRRSVIEDFIEEEMREENISGEDQGASFQTANEYSSVKNKAAIMSQKNSKPKSMPNAQGEDVDCHCYFPTLRMRKFKM